MDLKNFDLNLLLVFDEMLKARNVSTVANNLGVTQPAISRSLKRLRVLMGDELFYRTPKGMEPTSYALHLAEPIGYALGSLRSAISQEYTFDPKTSRRNFTIRMSDIGEICILTRLLHVLDREAPNVSITIVRDNINTLKGELEAGRIDLAIGLLDGLEAGFFRRQIYKQGYVCVFRHDHPLASRQMSLQDFMDAEHAVVTATGTGHVHIDELIEKQGIHRKIKLRIPNYASLEHVLGSSNFVATVPESLVQPNIRPFSLAISKHPVALPLLSIDQFWHSRFHKDPGNSWLRNLIAAKCMPPTITEPAPEIRTVG